MAVSNVELRVDARQAVNALRDVNRASTDASAATEKLKSAFATAGQVQSVFSAKVTNTEGAIRKQIAALREVQSKVQLGGALYQKAAGQIAEYEAKLRAANTAQNNTRLSSQGLIGTLGGIAAAYGQLRIAQQAVQAGIQREESVRRLQFLAQSYGEVAQAQIAAARTGKQFGLSITESNQQFAQLYGRLRPLNVSLQDIEAAFVGFNTAAKVSGTTTAESAGALLQLTQALGSGVLRGQELNSVLEQAPGLVVALTKELGKPVSEIRKLAEQGQITSDVVIRALKRAGTDGAGQLAAAMQGPAQQIKNLQNAFENFQVAVAQNVLPAVIGSVKALTRILEDATQYVKDFAAGWKIISSAAASAIAPFQGVLNKLAGIDGRLRSIGQNPGLRLLASIVPGPLGPILNAPAELGRAARLRGSQRQGPPVPERLQRAVASNAIVPTVGGGGGGGGKASSKSATEAERAAEAAKKEAERVAEVIRNRLAEGQITQLNSQLKEKIAAAEIAGDKQLVARLQGQQKLLDIQYKYAQDLAKETDIKAQQAIIYDGITKQVEAQRDMQFELNKLQHQADQDRVNSLQKHVENQYQLNASVQQHLDLADSIASTMGQGMTSAFGALISGAQGWEKSLQSIASGVLVEIANQLIRIFVIEQAINAIKTFLTPFSAATPLGAGGGMVGKYGTLGPNYGIPQRATGGSVTGNRPYLVGERGPELFMPGRSGGIAPAGSFGGGANIVVNVDASGSSVQGDGSQAKMLGAVVGAAVQAELIKQKRPGGLLY